MIALKQGTASQEIPLGIFVDSSDGNTEESGLTIANTDIKLWKSGATALVSKNSGGATYMSNGIYYCILDATDTDTVGSLAIYVHVAGALAIKTECVVYPANVYDMLFGNIEGTIDVVEALRIMLAVLAGESAGGGTTSITFKDQTGAVNRVSATVNTSGDRTDVTVNGG